MVEKIKAKKRKKILVTGSNGMLGIDLCNKLSSDYDVVGLDVKEARGSITCDITDKGRVIKSIRETKPDLIIHTAAWTDVDGCEKDPNRACKINVDGTENVVLSARELKLPLVHISTDFVFDGKKRSPYTEEDQPNPESVYAQSKLEGEKKVRKLEKFLILRTGWLYGKNGKNFVSAILKMAKNKKELKVVNDQTGSPTYTKDFAEAVGNLLKAYEIQDTRYAIHEIFHITNKGMISWFEYAKEILKMSGLHNVKVIPITTTQLGRAAKRPLYSVLDNDKFEKATNFMMRPWQEALKEYLNEATTYGAKAT